MQYHGKPEPFFLNELGVRHQRESMSENEILFCDNDRRNYTNCCACPMSGCLVGYLLKERFLCSFLTSGKVANNKSYCSITPIDCSVHKYRIKNVIHNVRQLWLSVKRMYKSGIDGVSQWGSWTSTGGLLWLVLALVQGLRWSFGATKGRSWDLLPAKLTF